MGRVTLMLSNDPGGVPWLEREYTYDRNGRRLSERRLDDANQVDEYVYDSADRVVTSRLDQFGGISRRDQRVEEFSYDGVGNRRRTVRSTASSTPVTTVRREQRQRLHLDRLHVRDLNEGLELAQQIRN